MDGGIEVSVHGFYAFIASDWTDPFKASLNARPLFDLVLYQLFKLSDRRGASQPSHRLDLQYCTPLL